jgi:hypothetical protein
MPVAILCPGMHCLGTHPCFPASSPRKYKQRIPIIGIGYLLFWPTPKLPALDKAIHPASIVHATKKRDLLGVRQNTELFSKR